MLNSVKVGCFIMSKRKAMGLTQQQLADKLNVSFQAISKWENGTTYPNIEILQELAAVLDTIVCGNAEKDTIKTLVKGISEACRYNECSLVGGETSIQPLVVG